MQHQILKVNDIEQAIKDNGLEYYVDRLLQDAVGDYFYIEVKQIDQRHIAEDWVWGYAMYDGNHFRYRVERVPRSVAWFVVDALRIQAQLMCVGRSGYDTGPHGGEVKAFIKDGDDWREVDHRVMVIEEL